MLKIAGINKSLSGRALIYMGGQLTLNFLSVLSAPLFVRMMSTSEYGLAAIYFTWVSLFANVVGLRVEGSIQNARTAYGEAKLKSYASSVMFLALILFALLALLAIAFLAPLSTLLEMAPGMVLLALVTSFFIACSNFRMAYMSAVKNATGNLLVSLVLSVAQIACSLFMLMFVFDDGYLGRTLGYSLPTIAIGLCILFAYFIAGRTFVKRDYWKFCLSLSIPLIFNGISILLINQSDRLMINSLLGAEQAGIYSFAYSSALLVSVVCSALNSAWVPEYYDYMKNGNREVLSLHANRYMKNITAISIVLMLVSPEILIILGTEEYHVGIPMLPLIVLAYYFQYLYTWPVNCEFYFRKTKGIAGATAVAAAINITLNLVLIPRFGMIGAAAASLIAYVALLLMHDQYARRSIPGYDFTWSWYFKGIIPVVLMTVVTYLMLDSMPARWCAATAVGGILLYRLIRDKAIL